MKNKKTIFGIITALSMLFFSCSESSVSDLQSDKKVNFSAQITKPLTRASSDAWESNDAIGIYALQTGQALSQNGIYKQKANIKYITQSTIGTGKFEAENDNQSIKFPSNGEQLDFIAYYPYKENISDYKIALDISNQTDITAIDLLYAKKVAQSNANIDVILPFSHQLSRVMVKLTAENGIDLTNATVIFKNAISKGTFDLTNTITSMGTATSNITAFKNGNTATAILLPKQDMSNISIEIVLQNGKKYEWTPVQYLLKAGKSITYSLFLTPEDVKTNTSATINDWENTTDGNQTDTLKPKTTTPPASNKSLFTSADFEDWTAFENSLNSKGVKYAVQNNDGRNGTKALYLNQNVANYTDIFTAKVPQNFTVPNKITLYIKGTSTEKSLYFIIKTTDNKKKRYFNLKDCTTEKSINPTKSGSYTGKINTNEQWVKITLDISSIKNIVTTTVGEDLFTLRLGKSAYNLQIDDIMTE